MSNDLAVDARKFSRSRKEARNHRVPSLFFSFSERNPSRSSAGNPDIRKKIAEWAPPGL